MKRDDGTRIEVTLGPSPVVLVFGAIWILFVLGLLMSAFSGGLEFGGSTRLEPWAIPVGMLLIGVVMFGLGRFSARGEGAFLLRFLQQELKAAIGR